MFIYSEIYHNNSYANHFLNKECINTFFNSNYTTVTGLETIVVKSHSSLSVVRLFQVSLTCIGVYFRTKFKVQQNEINWFFR